MPKTLLIDGDMLVYTLGYASESRGEFLDGSKYVGEDFSMAKRLILRKIALYEKLFPGQEVRIILSGKGNFRYNFYPNYKANRVALTKPLSYNKIREWLIKLENTTVVDGEEADDYIAALITQSKNYTAITADKDFYTVPGRTYNVSAKRLFHPTPSQAICFLCLQALAGDRVDGYYGVQWLGEAKSQKLLQACRKLTIRQAFLKLKKLVLKRKNGKAEWKNFQTCLALAAIRWAGETGDRGIGIRRIWRLRTEKFEMFLPYYNVAHNEKFGREVSVS